MIPATIVHRLTPPAESWNEHNQRVFRLHCEAARHPRGVETGILQAFAALEQIAFFHQARYRARIGDDFVLGRAWEAMARGLIRMLEGGTGRLDAGLLDAAIRLLASDHGARIE